MTFTWPCDCSFATDEDAVRRSISHSCYARVTSAVMFLLGLLALLSITACRQGVPVFDPGSKPDQAWGTISGTVRGPSGTSAIEGRTVEVINVATGAREKGVTSNTGGFTFKVAPGKYRVEVTLLEGEKLLKQPGEISVNRSDVDAHADFIVGTNRMAHPPFAAPRFNNGLGPPIA